MAGRGAGPAWRPSRSPAAAGRRRRAGPPVRRGCGRRAGSGSAPPAADVVSSRQPRIGDRARRAAGPRRTGPRRRASAARRRRGDGRGGPGCRRGPRRPARPGGAPSDPGPSRSSSAPRTGGRRPLTGGTRRAAGRAPRRAPGSGTPGERSSQASVAADVRPATRSSAFGSRATARTAARRSRTGTVDGGGRVAGLDRPGRAADQDEVERAVDVDAEPPAASEVATGKPASSASQRGSTLSDGRSGRPRQHVRRRGDRDDVRRVAVVREGDAGRRPPRRPPGRATIAPRRERDRAGAEERRARPAGRRRRSTATRAPNGSPSGGPADDPDVVGARPRRTARVVPGQPRRGRRPPSASSGPAAGPGSGCMIRTVTGGMARSLAAAIEGTVTTRRIRAYIGLGANVGDATATLTEAVAAVAGLPGIAAPRRLAAVRDRTGRRHRPARVPQRRRRDRRAGGTRSRDRGPGAPDRAQGARARLRPPACVVAGVRASSTSTCSSSGGRGSRSSGRPRLGPSTPTVDPAKAARLLEVPHPAAAARLFVLAPLADIAPRPRAARLGRDGRDRPPPARDRRGTGRGPGRRDVGPERARRWTPVEADQPR